GEWDEHRVGVRDPHDVAERSAPFTAGDRGHAERRSRSRRFAARGEPSTARIAGPTPHLERHDHAVLGSGLSYLVADRENIADELVTERERSWEWGAPGHDGRVEVTGRDGDRAHQGVGPAREAGCLLVVPLE